MTHDWRIDFNRRMTDKQWAARKKAWISGLMRKLFDGGASV